jgi:hypothetical protein
MALPVIKHPTYKITIPSTKKEVNIRPFTVQEEKILLMAKSSENTQDIVSAVKQVIRNCIVEPVDVDAMATFDIEYIFIKLRAKSVGEIVDLEYTDPETEDVIKFKINLDDVEVKYNPEHTNKINVFDDVGIVMRYPTLEEIEKVESSSEKSEEAAFKMLMKCIETIYDQNNVYSDYSEKELSDFVDSLPMESMNKVKQFFDTMPSVEHEVNLKNKQGKNKTITLKGITSFFT